MAEAPARERIIAPWLLLLLGLAVAAVLYAVRPDMRSVRTDLTVQKPSELSVSYLHAWLRVAPDSPVLREMLVRQYLGLGQWDRALGEAERLATATRPDTYETAILLEVDALQGQAFEAAEGSPRRAEGVARVARLLEAVNVQALRPATLESLANVAQAVGSHQASRRFYAQLAVAEPQRADHWFALLGAEALSAGQYAEASQAYFSAQAHTGTRDEQRIYFFAAVGALVSGDQVGLACDQAQQHIGTLADDLDTLRFMVRLAEQANRPDLVRHYGQLLSRQLAWAPRFLDGARGAVATGWVGSPQARKVADDTAQPLAKSQRESDFDLLYKAFVASGALKDAQDIAERALARRGTDRRLWLLRLAQVADWNNQPQVAFKAWSALAGEFDDPQAWKRLLVMAPQLDDDRDYLKALLHASAQDPDNFDLIQQVTDAYERLGNPEAALKFLQSHAGGVHARKVQELQAGLAQRSGHDARALEMWLALQARYGSDPSYAMNVASLEYAAGRPEQALAALRQAGEAIRNHRPVSDGFWQAYIDLARLLGQHDELNRAVQEQFRQGATLSAQDFNNILFEYDGYPADAARIADAAFQQTGDTDYLRQAIESYTTVRDWRRIDQLLAGLTARQRQALDASASLLGARAAYELAANRPDASLVDFRRAYALPDGPSTVGIPYLWALLSFGTDREARRVMLALEKQYGSAPEYAPVLGAAHLQLGQPREALNYMNLQAATSRQDPLWLMTYADAREAAGDQQIAWRVRREAWRLLNVRSTEQAEGAERRGAQAVLSQTYASGDVSLGLLARLLRKGGVGVERQAVARSLLGDLPGLQPLPDLPDGAVRTAQTRQARRVDAATYATALAWATSGERQDLARAWLADRYISDMLKPDSARIAVALLDDDRETMAKVLERDSTTVSEDQRLQAQERLGRIPQAQTTAFETLDAAPDSDTAYDNWVDVGLRNRPSTGLDLEYTTADPLQTRSMDFDTSLMLTSRLGLKLRHVERLYKSLDDDVLAWVPARDQESGLSLFDVTATHRYELGLGWRNSLTSFGTGLAAADWLLGDNWTATTRLGMNQYSDITGLMTVAGSKDLASFGLSWDSQRNWFASASVEYDRFHAQGGPRLGTGLGYEGALGLHLRNDRPDVNLSAVVSQWHFTSTDAVVPEFARLLPDGVAPTASEAMSDDTLQYGLVLNVGTEHRLSYERSWQPFLEVSWIHDRLRGWGAGARAGIGGSVIGRDRLGFFVSHEPASQGDSRPTTNVGMFYRFFY